MNYSTVMIATTW